LRGSARSSVAGRWLVAGRIDLGNDPPLTIGGKSDNTPVLRTVSLRWLSGTILTGFTSMFLMGGALLVALTGQHQLMIPQEALTAIEETFTGLVTFRRSDRIRPTDVAESSRVVFDVPTITRQQDGDLKKLRPFARIIAPLSVRKNEFTDEIPAFDPLRIFAEGTIDVAPAEPGTGELIDSGEMQGEVGLKVSDFPFDDPGLDESVDFKTAEVEEIVHAAAGYIAHDEAAPPLTSEVVDLGDGIAIDDPLGVSIVPENVTLVQKSEDGGSSLTEKLISIQPKETFRQLLVRNSVRPTDANEINTAMSDLIDLTALKPGQRVRIGLSGGDSSGGPRPMRVSIYQDDAHQATVARNDHNAFVRADPPGSLPTAFAAAERENRAAGGQMPRLYEAIYQTALEQQMTASLVPELIKIFSYEVDYQSQIGIGDSIEVFHSMPDNDPNTVVGSEEGIVYASITLGGVKKRFYRYRTPDDGITDYYDEDGRSAKKFLMRKPMTVGRYVSGFGNRRHPILGTIRMHGGVDWAAPRGTPIMAAGDGIAERVSRTSGYGNLTVIKHTNGYMTAYAHQSAFAKGLTAGTHVRQGQIIGFVGSTGLSTGPHLHYEVRVNSKLVDPLRIRLPRGRVLEGEILIGFKRERERVDSIITRPASQNQKVAAAPADVTQ
jgi:murein DD-endopeptidase MepM/ murein hydrolase activator NlpD